MLLDRKIQLVIVLRAYLQFAAHFLCQACTHGHSSIQFSLRFEYDMHQLDSSLLSSGAAVADECLGCK